MPRVGRLRLAAVVVWLLIQSYSGATSLRQQLASEQNTALLAEAESAFREYRYYDDQVHVTRERNATKNLKNVTLRVLEHGRMLHKVRANASLRALLRRPGAWSSDDWRAISVMRDVLADDSSNVVSRASAASQAELGALQEVLYESFGQAAESISVGGRTYDRLRVLGLLPVTEGSDSRRRLFMALDRVWRTVNGDNHLSSPYRRLVRLRAEVWRAEGSPFDRIAREARLDLPTLESWIVSAFDKWRTVGPQSAVEPWDFFYVTGKATRDLSRRVRSRRRLESLRDRYYDALLGVDRSALGIHFDLKPRKGKNPVAAARFGRRNFLEGARWIQGEFWVFASYATGNLDNLYELMHETGHSIHIAAIRTRPAFTDFPDGDAFTEALADATGLEVYEPRWQKRFLGTEAAPAVSLQNKYSSIVMDMALGLFEIRIHRDPAADPNQLWTEITRKYLNIEAHPELSWWAVRGQLLDAPGYMSTYALGHFMAAALRARIKAIRGQDVFSNAPADLYGWLTEKLYRHGRSRPAMQVVEEFLGGALRPEPLLDDLGRASLPRDVSATAQRPGRRELGGRPAAAAYSRVGGQ